MNNFTHLHVHTDHSLLMGYGTIEEYINKCKEYNYTSLAITDINTMAGVYSFITECKKNNIKPIVGIDINIAPTEINATVKEPQKYQCSPPQRIPNRGSNFNLVLLAKDMAGLRNLYKITESSYKPENYFNVPRIDLEILKEYKEGLIALSGNASSELSTKLRGGLTEEAKIYAATMKEIFKDDFYIEITNSRALRYNASDLVKLANELDIKYVFTNDVFYANPDDNKMHEIVMCIGTRSKMDETGTASGGNSRTTFSEQDKYFKSQEEVLDTIKRLLPYEDEEVWIKCMSNTQEIADKVDVLELEYNSHLRPKIEIPEEYGSNVKYLMSLIQKGFNKIRRGTDRAQESVDRIKEEFEVIVSNDFVDYFLVVWDYCKWSEDNGWNIGAGRGSCAGSEIAFLLGIHKTDPLKFGLLFERFISPGRGATYEIKFEDDTTANCNVAKTFKVNGEDKYTHQLEVGDVVDNKIIKSIKIVNPGSPPDIDTDFHTEGRNKVMEYVREKYGVENVASIITPGPFLYKNAFKSVCSAYNIPFYISNKISEYIPPSTEDVGTLLDYYNSSAGSVFRAEVEAYDRKNNIPAESDGSLVGIVKKASRLNGRLREAGVHACGIIISSEELNNTIPVQLKDDGMAVTQWNYYNCEALGLIKMDFLGLDTVDIIQNTVKFIKETKGIDINLSEIRKDKLEDKETLDIFRQGHTVGIFQFSGDGVRNMLVNVAPTRFEDLAAITALYRPGPMGLNLHTDFAKRKRDESARIPVHKDFYGTKVEEVLKDTLNALTYQESIMQIARRCAGFNAQEADTLRKAVGKKNPVLMKSMEEKFKNGMLNNKDEKYSKEAVDALWSGIEGFGQYAFNKCLHADTILQLADGSVVTVKDLYNKFGKYPVDLSIMSLYPNSTIKPHLISSITPTGYKPCYELLTNKGRRIKITEDHRMLTLYGYRTIKDGGIKIGSELVSEESVSSSYTNQYNKKSNLSYSILELVIKDYLDCRGIEYTPHAKIDNDNHCSFYINGQYFEADDFEVGDDWFISHKYKGKPFIRLTPGNYMELIDEKVTLNDNLITDTIVDIIYPEKDSNGEYIKSETYDIEMELNGPSNFIANGLVSHNSHACAYALNSFQAAYFKAHYPIEFMSALLRQRTDSHELGNVMQEIRRMKIKILPPSINDSETLIKPDDKGNNIVYGLSSIKGMNEDNIRLIIQERERNGKYKDIDDFIVRMRDIMTPTLLKTLAKAGAFDCINVPRKEIFDNADKIIKSSLEADKYNAKQSNSLFGMIGNKVEASGYQFTGDEWGLLEKARNEYEATSMYLSTHPLDNFEESNYDLTEKPDIDSDCYVVFSEIKLNKYKSYELRIDNKVSQVKVKLPKKTSLGILKTKALRQAEGENQKQRAIKIMGLEDGYNKKGELITKETLFDNIKQYPEIEEGKIYKVKMRKIKWGNTEGPWDMVSCKAVNTDENGNEILNIETGLSYNQAKELLRLISLDSLDGQGNLTIRLIFKKDIPEIVHKSGMAERPSVKYIDIPNMGKNMYNMVCSRIDELKSN